MPAEAASTSCHGSSLLQAADTAQYTEFLMCDTCVTYQHAGYHSKTSTSGHVNQATEVSTSTPDEGVLRVVTGKGPIFSSDFLESNMLTDWELAKIRAE
ncbi:unnamed protein product [Prunus armeniaca]|uniref:Uncharacterized protein n=1 Tax=Prunus armeniaca TaxID=36596 RepID=A0A6J5WZB7_PRUAR|nr:unnamed protein product [Prunus armeniaca]